MLVAMRYVEYQIGSGDGVGPHDNPSVASGDQTIAAIIERCHPMGDLTDLVIDDLTEEGEDEFFGILEDV